VSLSSISIQRPVLAVVMSTLLVIFGVVGYSFLGVREFPSVDPAIISITTNYPGANARVIETQITTPLEEQINSVPGIRNVTSVSRDGRSTITIEFLLGIDLETAANDVRDKVASALGRLPPDVEPPGVAKADADSIPIVFLGVRSQRGDLLELTAFTDTQIKTRLETIPGVSEVSIWGAKHYAMRLWIDPVRLAAYQLTPMGVRAALESANVELPSGLIEGDLVELTVRTLSRLTTPEDFDHLIIKNTPEALVRFADIGHAELGPLNERTILKRDGIPMVGVVLRPQPGANYIEIVDEFRRRVAQIEPDLPDDISVSFGFDVSTFIRDSVREVRQTILIAGALVVLIIFLFLREWRSTLIPIIVIPIALTASFFIMYLAGYSINVLTLLALVLAIGLVVDDAIVVLENIYAKIEQGLDPVEAGRQGIKEIFFAVIATTATLAAVFTPLLFLGGLTGQLFREFGVVLAGCVIISSFVALTLTPMLCVRLLKRDSHAGWFYRGTEPFFTGLTRGYRRTLDAFLRVRWAAWIVVLACLGVATYFLESLPRELAPLEDRSALRINVIAPEGTSYAFMAQFMDELDGLLRREVPEILEATTVTSPGFGAASSVNSGFARITLVPPEQRERSQSEIAAALRRTLAQLSGARASVSEEPTIGGRQAGSPIAFVVQAPSIDDLREALPDFLDAARADPTFAFVDVNLRFNKPELQVGIERDQAQTLGVSVRDIAQTLQATLGGQRFGYFIKDDQQYQVIGQLARADRGQPTDLHRLHVRAADGGMVPLDNLITLTESSTPPTLFRFNRASAATFSADLAPGHTIADGIAAMRAIADRMLDERFATDLTGQSRDYVESSAGLVYVFLFALVLVYLVLSAQFESFRDPLIIMIAVPLALAGSLLSLGLAGETLNVFSQIGLIMLIGLITKNGILIVEFANQRKAAGLTVREAAADAAAARFRPVLMTSLSTIFGMLPIALAVGAGSGSRVSMGVAVIGGLLLGSLLTLFVIPAIYSYVSCEYTAADRETAPVDTGQVDAGRPRPA
jgi:multidrug efflux pump